MNSIALLKQAKAELIAQSRNDSSFNQQIAGISGAILEIEFCNQHQISHKDEVIEI